MNTFWALRIHAPETKGAPYAMLEKMRVEDLTAGEVLIEVYYSSINFKDALAATGRGAILKRFPLNGGIDCAGVVAESIDPRFKPGDQVLVTGCGIGENDDGGYAEFIRVKADSVIPIPKGLTTRESMILGTAGFTAALALHRMLENHQRPDMGPIVVTGASGGVGSFAVQLFSQSGFEVHALSRKHSAIKYLKNLGAARVTEPAELNLGSRPLEKAQFGGAVDNVGGDMLARLLAHTNLWGNVCAVGLTDRPDLKMTVMPHILRGVSLLGISSNNCPRPLRDELWQKLAGPWRPRHLEETLNKTVGLRDLMLALDEVMHGQVQGRILVEIKQP